MSDGDSAKEQRRETDANGNGPPVITAEMSASPAPKPPARPWGPWASMGWTLVAIAGIAAAQVAVLLAFSVSGMVPKSQTMTAFMAGSLYFSTAAMATIPVVVGLVVILIRARGCQVGEYLALHRVTGRSALLAVTGLALLLFASDSITYLLGRPIVPKVMVDIYKTGWFGLLLPALVLAAPLSEETLFRGFLFQGIASSHWGATAAVVVSTIFWTLLHTQYDWYSLIQVGAIGIYLGEVRRRTESLPLTMLLHGISNAVATAEMLILVSWQGG